MPKITAQILFAAEPLRGLPGALCCESRRHIAGICGSIIKRSSPEWAEPAYKVPGMRSIIGMQAEAVELRLGKIRGRLAQDLVGLSQFAVLAFQRLQLVRYLDQNPSPLTAVDLGLLQPLLQRLGRAADLLRNGNHRCPPRRVIALVIQHHPYRSLADFRRNLFVVLLILAPPSQELEPPALPGAFKFSREFKLESVKLVRECGVSVLQAARDLDLHENVLRK